MEEEPWARFQPWRVSEVGEIYILFSNLGNLLWAIWLQKNSIETKNPRTNKVTKKSKPQTNTNLKGLYSKCYVAWSSLYSVSFLKAVENQAFYEFA